MAAASHAAGDPPYRPTITGHWKDHRTFLRMAGAGRRWEDRVRRKDVPRRAGPAPSVTAASANGTAIAFRSLDTIDVILAENPTEQALEALRSAGAEVLPDTTVSLIEPVGATTAATAAAPAPGWHLHSIKAPAAWAQNLYGQGVTVGVLDTGIDARHAEFEHVPIKFKAFGPGVPADQADVPRDFDDHGTHVCGIIAGQSSGLARRASLKVAAVLTARNDAGRPTGNLSDLLKGLNWLTDVRSANPALVVNASLTFGGIYRPLEARIEALRQNNQSLVVGAIGNHALTGSRTQSPGNYVAVAGVGATDPDDVVAPFSEWNGEKPDLCAPGVGVWSAVPGGMASNSGTSMAAPLVSATAALLCQKRPAYASDLRALFARLLQLVRPCTPPTSGGAGTLDISSI